MLSARSPCMTTAGASTRSSPSTSVENAATSPNDPLDSEKAQKGLTYREAIRDRRQPSRWQLATDCTIDSGGEQVTPRAVQRRNRLHDIVGCSSAPGQPPSRIRVSLPSD